MNDWPQGLKSWENPATAAIQIDHKVRLVSTDVTTL